jgi:uncharacterized membrane protein YbhN (UPF0104 family)
VDGEIGHAVAMLILLKAILTVVVLWFVSRSINLDEAINNLAQLSIQATILAFACLFAQLLVASERLRLAMVMMSHRISYRIAFRAAAEGNFFANAFISVLGSDAARVWRLQRSGLPLVTATGGVLLDRFIGLAVSHLAMCVCLLLIWHRINDDWMRSALLALAVGLSVVLLIICLFGVIKLPQAPQYLRRRIQPIYEVSRVTRHAFRNLNLVLAVVVHSLAVIAANVAIFFILLKGLGAQVGFVDCLLVVPIVIQISLLPISIAGWGMRESAAVMGFGYLGVDGHIALVTSVIFGLLMLIFSLWGGVLWWIDHHRPSIKIRESDQP